MKLKYGFSYYPEHCSSLEEINADIELIYKSGANTVRMGEFAWDQIEKKEGEFNFDVFLYTVDELGKLGINTVFCTPTSCPPAWLMKKHPEISYIDYRGVKRPFGSRHHYCYNNPTYRQYSAKIVQEIVKVFGENPYIIGFQIGNEFAQESTGRCHCNVCKEKFRNYLKERYVSIENLNKSCGTYFWGESFTDFHEISIPIANGEIKEPDLIPDYFDNPSLRLNFDNFASNSFCEYLNIQNDILKTTGKPVTTNSTGFGTNLINYYEFFKELDIFGLDIYPALWSPNNKETEFSYSFSRAMKNKPFWILEFSIGGGHGLWAKEGRLQPVPGAIELSVMHAFASGAELLTHFQYKTYRIGSEQLNYALLDQDRVPRRKYFEFSQTAKMLEKYSDIFENSTPVNSSVAVVFDYNSLWALKIKPINHDFSYIDFCSAFYNTLREIGIEADIISPEADFSKYSLLITPSPFLTNPQYIKKIENYVKEGGNIVSTFLTSVKDYDNVAYDTSLPSHLTNVFGVTVSEVEPVFDSSRAKIVIEIKNSKIKKLNYHWIDELSPISAETIGYISDTYRKGKSVITKNIYGKGCAYYIGTMPDANSLSALFKNITEHIDASVCPFNIPNGCSVVKRISADKVFYFIFNFTNSKKEINLISEYRQVFGEKVKYVNLNPYEYLCLEEI